MISPEPPWIRAPPALPEPVLLRVLPLPLQPLPRHAGDHRGRNHSKTWTIWALSLHEENKSLQSQPGPCSAPSESDLFTPRVSNSFVSAQTVLVRKAPAGFGDAQCRRICDECWTSVLFFVPLHFAGLNSLSPAIVLPSSAGQKVLIFPFFSL